MKRIYFSILFLLGCIACEQKHQPTMTYQTILIDLTDDSLHLNKNDLKPFGILEDDHDAMCLSLSYITDIGINPTRSICIDSLSPNFSENVLQRKNQLRIFNQECDSLLSGIRHESLGYSESHIFKSVVSELELLAEKPKDSKRQLVLFSDLFENNSFFNYYGEDKNRLNDIPALAKSFKQHYAIPENLQGIHLEIRFTPTRNNQYDHASFITLYRLLLEPHGCIITTKQETITYIE